MRTLTSTCYASPVLPDRLRPTSSKFYPEALGLPTKEVPTASCMRAGWREAFCPVAVGAGG